MAKSEDVKAANDLADRIGAILAGKNSELQGAALSLCTAIWAAGHISVDGPEETRRMRGELLTFHFWQVTEAVGALTGDKPSFANRDPAAGRA
jgi:hypothetical protein